MNPPLRHRIAGRISPGALRLARRSANLSHGCWPRALADFRLRHTTRTPVTLSEKMRYRLAYDRRPILRTFADKVAVRDYVAERIGETYLTHLYGIYGSAADLRLDGVPEEFVCKASHGSGASVIVWKGAPRVPLPADPRDTGWELFTVHPDDVRLATLRAYAERWLSLDYEYAPGRLPEWGYRGIPRRILVEELLLTPEGAIPSDLKFWAFDGAVMMVNVISSRFGETRGDLFTRDWRVIPGTFANYRRSPVPPPRPDNLDELIEIAEALAAGMDMVRVDLYNLAGRVVFGEMTASPGGYPEKIRPASFNRWVGQQWRLPEESELAAGGLPVGGVRRRRRRWAAHGA